MKKILTLLLLFICIAFSCERDDLCPDDTPTTPKMVVEFRDVTLNDNPKNVLKLRIEDVNDATRVLPGYNAITEDQMILPLKTDRDENNRGITQYRVYRDYDVVNDVIEGNPDILTIEYLVEDIYVSRACGYKTIFKNVSVVIEPDSDNWMLFAPAENDNQSVINEDEIHFTIRH